MNNLAQHLIEVRKRLLRCLLVLGALVLILFPFANPLYTTLAQPLLKHLPNGSHMIATQVASPLIAPLKLTIVIAVLIAIPFLLYQIWAFVAPGLYKQEKRFVGPLLLASSALFYIGVAFAYFLVLPIIMQFFVQTAPAGVVVMTDISSYLDFVLQMFLAFGITFEVPLIVLLLIRTGIVDHQTLVNQRPYIIIGAFVVGMLLTPPDVFSQILLAVPLCLLFELGLLLSRWWPKHVDNTH
jgi:sec-independent protein translocase protein TatC